MPEELLLERASLMGLTAQEMTCLVGACEFWEQITGQQKTKVY